MLITCTVWGCPPMVDYITEQLSPSNMSGGTTDTRQDAPVRELFVNVLLLSSLQRRLCVRREWCACVIQRSVRSWLRRRLAARVRSTRAKHRQQAATLIQRRWMIYIKQKRRYEATCAQLKARLHQ